MFVDKKFVTLATHCMYNEGPLWVESVCMP